MKYNESNKPIVCMQTQSTCYKSGQRHTIKGILFHSTGCNNPNIKRYVQPSDDDPNKEYLLQLLGVNTNHNDWNHIYHEAGLNAWIGKLADGTVATVQTMPYELKPWGAGVAYKGGPSCNNGWIQFEICEDNLASPDYFNAVYAESVEFAAYLCKMYNLDPMGTVDFEGKKVPVITCHNDAAKLGLACNHADINHWFPKYGKNMDTVRADIKALLGVATDTTVKPIEPVVEPDNKPTKPISDVASDELYRVRKSWNDAKSQIGAFKVLDNAIKVCKEGYSVFDSKGNVVYTNKSQTSQEEVERTVWNELLRVYRNELGVAGIMGNLYAESGIRPNNMQNTYERKLGFSDDSYTDAVDNGLYGNFVNDAVGYGLAQWTFWSRKEGLLNLCKSKGVSISDLSAQILFLVREINANSTVRNCIVSAKSVEEASDCFLTKFERPADQSENAKAKRRQFSFTYYNKFKSENSDSTSEESQSAESVDEKSEYKIVLNNVACYATSSDKSPYSYKSGEYYLWGSDTINGRVRITTKEEYIGVKGKVTCWINKEDAK